ncbi:MAG: arylsulfatase A-like enzyme, partial [Cyclobacteriaceae bacterium]
MNISIKHIMLYSILTIISLFLSCQSSKKQEVSVEKERPNIVLIMADDLGFSDLGCYGGEIETPNLDGLAKNGIRFTNFYNTGRCCPTRASLLTGLYPHQAGVGRMVYHNYGGAYQGYLNRQAVTLGEVLKTAGYKTLMSGKWHVGHQKGQWPTDRGFDRFYGINKHVDSYWKVLNGCEVYLDGTQVIPETEDPVNALNPDKDFYTTNVFTDYAKHFLSEEAKDSDQPFFLYLAYNSPHWPLEAPDEDIGRYRGKYMKGWDQLRKEKFVRMKNMGIIPANAELPPTENTKWDTLSLEDQLELDFRRAMYAAQVDNLDQNIGRLVMYLKEIDKYENTIILFLSDNGCSAERGQFGMNWDKYKIANYQNWKEKSGSSISQGQVWANLSNVPYRLYKRYNHQGGIATPLIAHWPAQIKNIGRLEKSTGHVIDIMATLMDLGNASYPMKFNGSQIKPLEGRSLLPVINGSKREDHPYVFWEHVGNRAIRKGDWKLVAEFEKEWELYDLAQDPTELNDL